MGRSMSDLFIGIILVGLFITVLVTIISYGSMKYQVQFDNTSFAAYDKINETYNITKSMQSRSNFNSTNNAFDIVGSVFSQAFGVIRLAGNSYDTVDTMKNEAIEESNLGPLANIFSVSIGAIVLIIIVVAILLRYVIKERT